MNYDESNYSDGEPASCVTRGMVAFVLLLTLVTFVLLIVLLLEWYSFTQILSLTFTYQS